MGNPVDPLTGKHEMECQSCHGPMVTVGKSTRSGWYDMPTCQSCHHDGVREKIAINISPDGTGTFKISSDKRFASNDDAPRRVSAYTASAWVTATFSAKPATTRHTPSLRASRAANSENDSLRAIEAQGYVAAIRECTACHATAPKVGQWRPARHALPRSVVGRRPP